jgi:hypothetical protein
MTYNPKFISIPSASALTLHNHFSAIIAMHSNQYIMGPPWGQKMVIQGAIIY